MCDGIQLLLITAAAAATAAATAARSHQVNPHKTNEVLERILRSIDHLPEVKFKPTVRGRVPFTNQPNVRRKAAVDVDRIAVLVLPFV